VLAEYDRSPAQVVVRRGIQRGVVTLPKSSTPEHVRANADLDWELDDDDVRALDDRDREYPVYDTPARDWSRDRYGIER
jgi:2,5-diketo-D-gluconate reductase B